MNNYVKEKGGGEKNNFHLDKTNDKTELEKVEDDSPDLFGA